MPLYQILYLFIFVARCPNNPNTIIFFQSDTHLLMLFFSPWKICVFMTRQVDLLYMKHNTSFQSQVMLAATQNSNFPRGPEQFIGWFMKFSVDFHKLKNRFKITWLAVFTVFSPKSFDYTAPPPCRRAGFKNTGLAWFLCDVKQGLETTDRINPWQCKTHTFMIFLLVKYF